MEGLKFDADMSTWSDMRTSMCTPFLSTTHSRSMEPMTPDHSARRHSDASSYDPGLSGASSAFSGHSLPSTPKHEEAFHDRTRLYHQILSTPQSKDCYSASQQYSPSPLSHQANHSRACTFSDHYPAANWNAHAERLHLSVDPQQPFEVSVAQYPTPFGHEVELLSDRLHYAPKNVNSSGHLPDNLAGLDHMALHHDLTMPMYDMDRSNQHYSWPTSTFTPSLPLPSSNSTCTNTIVPSTIVKNNSDFCLPQLGSSPESSLSSPVNDWDLVNMQHSVSFSDESFASSDPDERMYSPSKPTVSKRNIEKRISRRKSTSKPMTNVHPSIFRGCLRGHSQEIIATSTGKKDKVCDWVDEKGHCTKAFQRAEHLKRHKATHLKKRDYPCALRQILGSDICDKEFDRRDNRSQHHVTHVGCHPADRGVRARNKVVSKEDLFWCIEQQCMENRLVNDKNKFLTQAREGVNKKLVDGELVPGPPDKEATERIRELQDRARNCTRL